MAATTPRSPRAYGTGLAGVAAMIVGVLGSVMLLPACRTSSTTATESPVAADPREPAAATAALATEDHDAAYYREFVRDFVRLDELCWSISLQTNHESAPEDVVLVCRYDRGGVDGPGVAIVATDGNAALRSAIEEIGSDARSSAATIDPEELLALASLVEQLVERCWYSKIEKNGQQWKITCKELRAGTLYSKTGVAVGDRVEDVLRDALTQLDR